MMTNPPWVKSLWQRIQEPRVVTALQTLIYLLIAVAGFCIILWPPSSTEAVTGRALSYAWGAFALLGGGLGAYGTPGGRWYLERAAIWLCGTAILIYFAAVSYLQFTAPGNRAVQMLFIAIAGVALAIRFVRIKNFDFEPGK